MAVDGVHEKVEGGEGGEGGEKEGYAGFGEEGGEALGKCVGSDRWAGRGAGLQCPQDADAVDEGINLEMYAQAKKEAGKPYMPLFNSPK